MKQEEPTEKHYGTVWADKNGIIKTSAEMPSADIMKSISEAIRQLRHMQDMYGANFEALETMTDPGKAEEFLSCVTRKDFIAVLGKEKADAISEVRKRNSKRKDKWLLILEQMEIHEFVSLFEYVTAKKTYRTKGKLSNISNVPEQLALMSSKDFKHALSFYEGQEAYLLLLKDAIGLKVDKDGTFVLNGMSVSQDEMERRTEKNISSADPSFLSVPLSIIYESIKETGEIDKIKDVYSVYVPDLIKKLHNTYPSQKSIEAIIADFSKYDNFVGVLKVYNGNRYYKKFYKVLTFLSYDEETNRIEFSSPYCVNLLRDAYKKFIKMDEKTQKPKKRLSNGLYDTKPYITQIANINLKGEHNLRAVSIVEKIIVLIEEAGENTPKISARKLLEYMPEFYQAIEETATTSNKNLKLRRAFERAFEILNEKPDSTGKTRAGLKEKYKDIQMPAVTDWPTMATLDRVYTFKHKGKINPKD